MHATPSTFTSPTNFQQTRAVHFPTRAAASPQGLGGFAALYPNCGKQKKLSYVYDMRHNFASRRISILHDLIVENARTAALARSKAADPARRGENSTHRGILAMVFRRDEPRRDNSWVRSQAGGTTF
jgi:hypothetical protein